MAVHDPQVLAQVGPQDLLPALWARDARRPCTATKPPRCQLMVQAANGTNYTSFFKTVYEDRSGRQGPIEKHRKKVPSIF